MVLKTFDHALIWFSYCECLLGNQISRTSCIYYSLALEKHLSRLTENNCEGFSSINKASQISTGNLAREKENHMARRLHFSKKIYRKSWNLNWVRLKQAPKTQTKPSEKKHMKRTFTKYFKKIFLKYVKKVI